MRSVTLLPLYSFFFNVMAYQKKKKVNENTCIIVLGFERHAEPRRGCLF